MDERLTGLRPSPMRRAVVGLGPRGPRSGGISTVVVRRRVNVAVPAGGGELGVAELLVRRQGGPADRVGRGPRRGRRPVRVRRGVRGVGQGLLGRRRPPRPRRRPRPASPTTFRTRTHRRLLTAGGGATPAPLPGGHRLRARAAGRPIRWRRPLRPSRWSTPHPDRPGTGSRRPHAGASTPRPSRSCCSRSPKPSSTHTCLGAGPSPSGPGRAPTGIVARVHDTGPGLADPLPASSAPPEVPLAAVSDCDSSTSSPTSTSPSSPPPHGFTARLRGGCPRRRAPHEQARRVPEPRTTHPRNPAPAGPPQF